jgi:hypothetical protein
MDGGAARQFGWYLLFWLAYFTIVYSSLMFLYLKRRGVPPGGSGSRTDTISKAAWEERDRVLRKKLVRIGFTLMVAPLLFPILLRILG